MEVNGKEDIIKAIKEYGLIVDETYTEDESFLLICDAVTVNGVCFRDVRDIHFCKDTMWIDNASIKVDSVTTFRIAFMSLNHDTEELKKHFKQMP